MHAGGESVGALKYTAKWKSLPAKVAGELALDRLAELTKPNYGFIGIDLGTAQSMAARTVENPLSN